MNSIEKGLCPEIPLEEAADFFIKLKYGSAGPDGHKLAKLQKKMLKEKDSMMGPPSPAAMGTPPPAGAPPPAPGLPPTAMGKNAAFRKAASGMFGDGMVSPGSVGPKVDMHQYMAMEEMGAQAEESNQADFLRQKLQDAHAQLQAAQDQAQQSQQQTQQLQQQQA